MKYLIDFFLNRTLLVNMFSVMILIVGGFSLYSLQKETFPPVEFDVILISTVYPGSSSEDVEKLVTISIERKLKEVSGIKEINALSAEGRSIIYLEVEPDADLDTVLNDVKNAVDTVNDLPTDVEVPIITSLDNKQRAILKVALTGGDYKTLRATSKELRDELERLNEIALVNLSGYNSDEIKIELDPDKLNHFEVTVGEVYRAVIERNLNLSAGVIESPTGDLIIRTVSEFATLEEIRKVVVRSNATGYNVKVNDIGTVKREPKESSQIQRSNGKEAIFLDIKIKENADILSSTDKIKKVVNDFFLKGAKAPVSFGYADDFSYFVKRRLNILKDNGIIGIVLVFLCLLMFLNFRTSLITSLGAPIAFMVSFAVMDTMGVSINLISMFGLILVLGMLVDDSIIVAEYYYQKLEKGMKPKQAAREAAFETIKPVTATILTTIVAFGSLFFMGGIMGKFLWSVPAVVIICLLASLFECFFILPNHLAEFCRIEKKNDKVHWYDKVLRVYKKIINLFVSKGWRSWGILGVFGVLFIASGIMATKMKFELFPGDDVRTVFLQIKGKVGNPLEVTDSAMKKLETIAMENLKKDEFEQVRTQVGTLIGQHGNKTGSHYGSLILYLTPPDDRTRSTDEIINHIQEKAKNNVDGYEVSVTKVQGGPPTGKPVDIELTGESIAELKVVSKSVKAELDKINGVSSTEIDFEEGKDQFIVKVDEANARRLGLSTQQIALELRRTFSGDSVTEIRESDEDIEIKIFLDEVSRSKPEMIKNIFILNNSGRRIPLAKVINVETEPGAFIIRRLNRKRVFSVSGSIDKKVTTPVAVAKVMKPKVEKILNAHPSIKAYFGGENEDTKDSMMRLAKSGLIALFCIFLILVVMFSNILSSMVTMSAIPLGLIGVIWTFKISGQSLGFMAMMGVVALIGVVVNDSIVLVNFINKMREEGHGLKESIVEASASRFRAVIMTTFTTVAGLLPIAHPFVSKFLSFGLTKDTDPFLQPMAMSFAWGLLFASMVTLIFVPCNYYVFEITKNFFSNLFKSRPSSDGKEETAATGA